jgi:hypothetical protein
VDELREVPARLYVVPRGKDILGRKDDEKLRLERYDGNGSWIKRVGSLMVAFETFWLP